MKSERMTVGALRSLHVACFLVATGCTTVGRDYKRPDTSLPEAWTHGEAVGTNVTVATEATNQTADLSRWWSVFCDPVLSDLIERARHGNLDMHQAEARLRHARAQRALAAADRWPTVAANASASRSRGSEEIG